MRYKKIVEEKIEEISRLQYEINRLNNLVLEFKESAILYQAKWEVGKDQIQEIRHIAIINERNLQNEILWLRRRLDTMLNYHED